MAAYKVSRWELIVSLAIVVVTAALIIPSLHSTHCVEVYTSVRIPPLEFDQTPLSTVMERLDGEMQKQGRFSISHVEWENDALKSRLVTFRPETAAPLGEIMAQVEMSAQVKIDDSGKCGACGGPISVPTIRDAASGKDW